MIKTRLVLAIGLVASLVGCMTVGPRLYVTGSAPFGSANCRRTDIHCGFSG